MRRLLIGPSCVSPNKARTCTGPCTTSCSRRRPSGATRAIRSRSTIPFVLLSESETERMKWILSGMDGVRCLRLPVDVDQLKQVLASYLV